MIRVPTVCSHGAEITIGTIEFLLKDSPCSTQMSFLGLFTDKVPPTLAGLRRDAEPHVHRIRRVEPSRILRPKVTLGTTAEYQTASRQDCGGAKVPKPQKIIPTWDITF